MKLAFHSLNNSRGATYWLSREYREKLLRNKTPLDNFISNGASMLRVVLSRYERNVCVITTGDLV